MREHRLASLDALRGVAILLVLLHHPVLPFSSGGFLAPVVSTTYRFGWTGVDLFFVLSGFLVGVLLLRELKDYGRVDVRRFLTRRAFKIWPSYLLLIACVFALTSAVEPPHDAAKAFRHLVPNLLHVQNYWLSPRVQTWSLAVEEHFYLILPFGIALVARTRRPGAWLTAIAASLMVGCLALRWRRLLLGTQSAIPFVFST